jgi:hypothetical protein
MDIEGYIEDAMSEMKDDIHRLLELHLEITHYLTQLAKEKEARLQASTPDTSPGNFPKAAK